MRLEDYTSDVICQAMELPAFVEEHWRESTAPTLRLLLTPSFHPELCITVQVRSQGALVQVRALKEMLWRKEASREDQTIFEEEALITSEPHVQELLSLSSQALSAPPRSSWITIDGMRAEMCLASSTGIQRRKEHTFESAMRNFALVMVSFAWGSCKDPFVRNSLAEAGRYLGLEYPLEDEPEQSASLKVLVLGPGEDVSQLRQALSGRRGRAN